MSRKTANLQVIADPDPMPPGRPPVWKIMPALRVLADGGVIAYPTEAVYGLGCLPRYQPVRRLLHTKRRSPRKGLILVAASVAQLEPYITFPDTPTRERVTATWPGPVTWLLPARPGTPVWLTGDHTTLAVRVSAHPVVRAICDKAGALISTSANPAGASAARDAGRVRAYFGRFVDYVLAGPLGDSSQPTEIRDAVTGRIIRAGG